MTQEMMPKQKSFDTADFEINIANLLQVKENYKKIWTDYESWTHENSLDGLLVLILNSLTAGKALAKGY